MTHTPKAFLRLTQARRPGSCPACRRPIAVGDPVGVTWDRAWRCRDCAEVYALIGPPTLHLLGPEERQAELHRIEEIRTSHPITRTWEG